MTSEICGSNGATARETVCSTVYKVLNASGCASWPSQKRSRERRTYQLVNASANRRTSFVAVEISVFASAVSTFLTRRSEEPTSELQSRFDLVCRLLLEEKKSVTNVRVTG